MATALQKQLAAIAASSTHQLDLKAQKAAHGKSLLFEAKMAASQSFETLYVICYEGYRDLCALDSRFVPFSKSLFSGQSKVEDRTQMTKEENKKLDAVLEAFITLVGPRLLLKPAQKAVEWLVRRFRYVACNKPASSPSEWHTIHATWACFLATSRVLTHSQSPRIQHGMSGFDISTIPHDATVPCSSVHPPKPAPAVAPISAPIHPIAHQPTATDCCIHSGEHARLLQCPTSAYSQGSQGWPPGVTHDIVLVHHHPGSSLWHTRKHQHWQERHPVAEDRGPGPESTPSTEQLYAGKIW
jgi:hypothetical protein